MVWEWTNNLDELVLHKAQNQRAFADACVVSGGCVRGACVHARVRKGREEEKTQTAVADNHDSREAHLCSRSLGTVARLISLFFFLFFHLVVVVFVVVLQRRGHRQRWWGGEW